ncbi:hypothetical protein, partial [Anaerovibrio sp.]|uniref:hypothetical protein n=1 Tax=Anaerovibrio sp. TaxID=1872532 RepID=UPI0025C257A9
ISSPAFIGSKMFCLMRLEAPSLIQKTDAQKVTPAHTHSTNLGAGTKSMTTMYQRNMLKIGFILLYI